VVVPAAPQVTGGARGIDAEFARLAAAIPGFAGMSYDERGTLTVYTTAAGAAGVAGAATPGADVAARLQALGGPMVESRLLRATAPGTGAAGGAGVVVQAATYDYLQLTDWKARLSSIFQIPGVVYLDIDESANRLRVAMAPGASDQRVRSLLRRAGVPSEAVLISRTSPISRVATLRDVLRPVPAGAQIVFPLPSLPGFVGICSIGFNARRRGEPGAEFFVTASHCSDVQGGNQGTRYYQPFPVRADPAVNAIAVEESDPEYGNPGGLCVYAGARCRLSDALLARYDAPNLSDFGTIARTTFGLQRIGSLIIDDARPRWRIVGEFAFPFQGEIANKVGRSSGFTSGPVVATCTDVGVDGTDIVQICQDIVFAGLRAGDSGAGVFVRAAPNSNDVFLTGVLWGGGTAENGATVFVLSSMENIEFELGPLTTSAIPLVAAAP
jgi:hypothetical protein